MFGVGTDYCLLLVSRYREELRRSGRTSTTRWRMRWPAPGPAILASGLTVAISMLVLLVAENRGRSSRSGRWRRSASHVCCVAGLTLLPALLTIGGRRAFWPRRQVVAWDPEHAVTERAGVWRRFGDRVLQRPGPGADGRPCSLFAVGALGLLAYKEDYSTTTFFKKQTESVDGFKVLERALPGRRAGADERAGRARGRPGAPGGRRGRAPARRVAAGRGRR